MSELIIPPGSSDSPVAYSHYGVQVSNPADSVTLRDSTTVPGVVEVIITSGNAFVAPIDLNDSTVFNVSDGNGSSTITTAAGADIIATGGGNDTVSAGANDDFVDGGTGNNLLRGEDGNDFLLSSDGNDTLEGGNGIDLLVSGAGNDFLDGGADNDILIGGPGKDTLVGGDGDDRLQGGPGKDSLIGGAGKDRFRFEKAAISKKGGKKNVDRVVDFDPDNEVLEFDRQIFKNQVEAKEGKANKFGARGLLNKDDFTAVEKLSDDLGDARIIYEKSTGLIYSNVDNKPTALVKLDKNLDITASNFEIFY